MTRRTTADIRREIASFDSEFVPVSIAAGTPHRKRLQCETDDAAHALACLPDNIKKRLALRAELASAVKSEKLRAAAARRKADPQQQLRQWIFRRLRKMGFSRDGESGTSAYYRCGDLTVRISDHEVPMTSDRQWNVAFNDGFSWSNCKWSLVLTNWMDAARFLVEVRRELREMVVTNE